MKKELCPHCGASMMMNTFSMAQTLVGAMEKLAKYPGKPIRELSMSKAEYANVSKLKYWGFAHKTEDGIWHLTEDAKNFMLGKLIVPRVIYFFRNNLVKTEGECDVWSALKEDESKQKYRESMTPYLGKLEQHLTLFGEEK